MMRARGWFAAVLGAWAIGAQAAPAKHETLAVPGLRGPARIVVDRWGIPHIFAASERDAFFVQGWNAARDRLWQIDLWRKRGLGLLSASFGPAYVAQDRAARLLLYRGDMDAEWAAYRPGMKDRTQAFVDGINAYVRAVRAGRRPLPVEFRLTGSTPTLWRAEDVMRIRSHALVSNLTSEVARARVACAVGSGWQTADALRRKLEPKHETKVPDGLDPCAVTPDVLKDYVLGTEPVAFEKGKVRMASLSDLETNEAYTGSNNWVVAGSHTATGRPLLANDPHREIASPSLRYIVHMSAPGLDMIGAGEPAVPGISFGHNQNVAFGLTIFGIDQEDLYVYALNPANRDQYRYGDGWETMRVVHETIPVKGEAPREVELRFTRHGPVLDYDPAHARAFALRSIWMQPGAAGYLQASWLDHARNWADFERARHRFVAPPENFVFADRAGDTGWAAFGLSPVRKTWDGLLPVPGDGRYEWAGFLSHDRMPESKNPARGWFATANAYDLPAGTPPDDVTSYEWSDRSRIDRIEQVLAADPHVSVADSMALQTDSHAPMALRLTALVRQLSSPDPRTAKALALLKAWDGNETTDSVAATIYEVWSAKHLGRTVIALDAPTAANIIGGGSLDAVIGWLETFGPDRNQIMLASLKNALDELTARMGPDMDAWTWGRLHQAKLVPAVATLADTDLQARMTAGPSPIPGGPSTPKAAGYNLETFEVTHGASVRMVMDVGAWDNSRIVNTPGQSADPASPHYGDLFPLWATGQYVPMLFSRPAVEAAAAEVIDLTPAR
ncbi:MAG TPA: penicillin acylase family protein [Caulobacteraceae bacterium]|nr:penicillin acylase family protein [Caulobacteraceae bacterium]